MLRRPTIVSLVLFSAFTPAVRADPPTPQFIALSSQTLSLYRVRLAPVRATLVGPLVPLPAGSDLWEVVSTAGPEVLVFDRGGNRILRVDSASAAVLSVVPLTLDLFVSARGVDLGPDGLLYGLLGGMSLYQIDPTTGVSTFIAPVTGAARVEALAFLPDGRLMAIGTPLQSINSDHLYQLNPQTGELSLVAPMAVTDLDSLTASPDGFLYAADSQFGIDGRLIRIDPATADVVDLGPTGILSLNGIAAVGPLVCAADWNSDGSVNSIDISAFLTAWLASVQGGTIEGDFTGNGVVDSNDISAFLVAWLKAVSTGC